LFITKLEVTLLYHRVYGLVLDQLVPRGKGRTKIKKELGQILFDLFSLECEVEKDKMTEKEWFLYINFILYFFASEYGVYLRAPNEPKNVEQQTLKELLHESNRTPSK
jgi:hypothetical protein